MFGTHTGLWVTEHDCSLPGSIGEAKIITLSSSDSYLASKTLQPTYTFSVECCMYVAVCVLYKSGLKVIQPKSYCNYSVPGITQCCQT